MLLDQLLKHRDIMDLTIASEDFNLNRTVFQKLHFPALAGNRDFHHDCVFAALAKFIVNPTGAEVVEKGKEIEHHYDQRRKSVIGSRTKTSHFAVFSLSYRREHSYHQAPQVALLSTVS